MRDVTKKLSLDSAVNKEIIHSLKQIGEDLLKNTKAVTALNSSVSHLPTEDRLMCKLSDLLDANKEAKTDLQSIKVRFDQLAAAFERQELLLKFSSDEVGRLHTRIDSKIDLGDAEKVLKFRNDLEPHVRASVVRSMSKEVMLAVEDLKEKIPSDDPVLAKALTYLESQCKKAGLIPIDKLF